MFRLGRLYCTSRGLTYNCVFEKNISNYLQGRKVQNYLHSSSSLVLHLWKIVSQNFKPLVPTESPFSWVMVFLPSTFYVRRPFYHVWRYRFPWTLCSLFNFIKIHNNVPRDWPIFCETFPTFSMNDTIFHIILLVHVNNVMDMNNVESWLQCTGPIRGCHISFFPFSIFRELWRDTLSLKGGGRRMENVEDFLCEGFTAKLMFFTW